MSRTLPPRHVAVEDIVPGPRVATIGTFDGVHLGHRALIEAAAERAASLGFPLMAMTFEPVPAALLRPEQFLGRITSPGEKLRQLERLPIGEIFTITFDLALSQLTPESFMAWVRALTGLQELWVGEAFALGKNRSGNVDRLREIGAELQFEVTAVPRLSSEGAVISSSSIRRALLDGDVDAARHSLGRPFRISGEVIHGAHLGRTIGYPTANVAPPPGLVPLADGIYVSLTTIGDEPLPVASMTYVGTRPTVNAGERLVESHLFDTDRDLYGQTVHVDFLHRLRGDALFAGLEELIAQLKADETASRAYLLEHVESRTLV